MLSFTFAGKDSFKDFGIYVATRPRVPSPERRVSYIEVPGMDSTLRRDEGTYKDVTLAVECSLIGDPYIKIGDIKSWLLNAGESDLTFSYQPDRKYIAQVVNSIDFDVILKVTSHFVILFNCQPFQYVADDTPVTLGAAGSLLNPGTATSAPAILLHGTGAGSLTVNGSTVSFSNIDGSVIVNSELQETYKDTGTELIGKNNTKSGGYPLLWPGDNAISFSENITSIEITPNWRWL